MRGILLLTCIFIITACGTKKDTSEGIAEVEQDTVSTVDNQPKIGGQLTRTGVIKDRSSEEGCGFVIYVNDEGFDNDLDPGHLEDEFRVEGMEVVVTFDYSRRMSTCPSTMPIIIREIKKK